MKPPIPRTQVCLPILLMFLLSSCTKDKFPKYNSVRELVEGTVSREHLPGMIAAIVDSTGILQIESAGVRKIGSTEAITDDDQFHLGSCGKAMTSALMAMLVGENALDWESTVIEVFPELKDTILADYEDMTLHQLLTHRAGMEDPTVELAEHDEPDIRERRYLYLKDILKIPSTVPAGEYEYSNLGYFVAGVMAERVTGKSWEALMQERIFEPLGMNSAGFGIPGTPGRVDQPWGHQKVGNAWEPTQMDNPEEIGPAGTIHSSVQDWVKFLALFLRHDNTAILERSQIEELIIPVGDYACGWWVMERDWADGTVLTHSGTNTQWFVTVWLAPEINRAFIFGTNSFDDQTTDLSGEVIHSLIGLNEDN
ncbi:MAG: serine hydrolase domain-containing protein [Bacteroidales bacterium]